MNQDYKIDPVPLSKYPSFQSVTASSPSLPPAYTATVLLHPFSPPLSTDPTPDSPFFQLCVAEIVFVKGKYFSAQVVGCSYGQWWYMVTPAGVELSKDGGETWNAVDVGWTLPTDWFGAQSPNAACAGRSPLNWMEAQIVEWWKLPVPVPNSPSAATWFWFDSESASPVRMMFGYGPPQPSIGDPTQLAFFQMWSFIYFPVYKACDSESEAVVKPKTFKAATFPGFVVGNPRNYEKFIWNSNFAMTAFMTPVNEKYNPLPTRVLYVWKDDQNYSVHSDRAQNTFMLFTYNVGNVTAQEALLTGPPPRGISPPPDSDAGFLITFQSSGSPICIGGSKFPFPQEPPDWVSTPAVEATIQATITDNPVLAPKTTAVIFSVLFPPSPPNYPEATYLWTWYSPQDNSGIHSRPITFMQSQSGVNVGTSLALADYFYYEELHDPIDPSNFDVPSACKAQTRKMGLRHRLP